MRNVFTLDEVLFESLYTGSIMQTAAVPMQSIAVLFSGRLLTGISGTFSNFLPVFVAECAPDNSR